jgi:hypothetical protein
MSTLMDFKYDQGSLPTIKMVITIKNDTNYYKNQHKSPKSYFGPLKRLII